MKKTIAVDMDDVLADLVGSWTNTVNSTEGESVKPEDIKCWDIGKYFNCGEKVYSYLSYDLFRNLPVIDGSQEAVKKLMDYYEVYIVSSATNHRQSLIAKIEWIEEHFSFFPQSNIVLCGKKDIIKADIMIDDGVHNLDSFNGIGLLFDRPHNSENTVYQRVKGWKDIVSLLL